MVNATFRTRLLQLLQRSRRAVRLYSSVSKVKPPEGNQRFSELQAEEWRRANTDLLRSLSSAIDQTSGKSLLREVVVLRDNFYREWRAVEAEVHSKQCALVFAAENGDFVRSALISEQLISLKARMQARQAVHHEVDQVLRQSRQGEVLPDPDPIKSAKELSEASSSTEESRSEPLRNVVPLRRG